MSITGNRVLRGALSLTISALIVKIIGVIFKVPLSYMLGDEGMGYFNTAYTVYGFFYVISCSGLPKAITIAVAGMSREEQNSSLDILCKRLLFIFGIGGSVFALAFIFLSSQISQLIGSGKSVYTMIAIGPTILFVAIGGVLRGYLSGLSSFKAIAISQLIEAICKLSLGLLLAKVGIELGMSLPLVSALSVSGITLGTFFSTMYLYLSVFRTNTPKKTGQKSTNAPINKLLRKIFMLAIPITASASIMSISSLIDLSVVFVGLKTAGYSEATATAIYGNYSTLVTPMLNLVTALLSPISIALLPRLANLNSRADGLEFGKAVNSAWRIVSFITIPILFIYLLYAFDTLDIIFGVSASAAAAVSLSAIAPAALLLPLLTVANTALEAKGHVGKTMISLLSGVVIKSIVSAILIPKVQFGIVGASVSTVLGYLVSLVVSLIFLARCDTSRIHTSIGLPALILGAISFAPPFILLYARGLFGGGAVATVITVSISLLIYFILLTPYFFHRKAATGHHNAQKNIAQDTN